MNIPIINLDLDLTKPYEILFGYCDQIRIPCIKQFNQLFDITGNALIYSFKPMKKNEYIIDANRIRFNYERYPTANESHFISDYDKIMNYKSIASLRRYKLTVTNNISIQILNQLKEDLIKKLQASNIQKKQEKLENIETIHTPEQSKERQTRLNKDYEYKRQMTSLNQQIQHKMNIIDERNEPELFKQHQEQLKPNRLQVTKTIIYKPKQNDYPYRSINKLKSLYDSVDETKIKHYNNFNVKQSKKDYSLKTYSKIPHSYIGDIFFQGRDFAFLLLININTRYAYAYQLGKIDEKVVHNVDENQDEHEITYVTKGQKTIESLKKAFNKHLETHSINLLRFDGERAINSEGFERYLRSKNIKYAPSIPGTHTSLSLIDRLCRTIRDIAFNLNIEIIPNQTTMNKILKYYNDARHEGLTNILFKSHPELKDKYEFISPSIMEHNPELETIYIKECIKYNFYISTQPDYELNKNDIVKVVSTVGKLGKKRTILDKDDYKIIKQSGNIYELKNVRTGEKIYKPRFEIKI